MEDLLVGSGRRTISGNDLEEPKKFFKESHEIPLAATFCINQAIFPPKTIDMKRLKSFSNDRYDYNKLRHYESVYSGCTYVSSKCLHE
jgi:hypothetical protein